MNPVRPRRLLFREVFSPLCPTSLTLQLTGERKLPFKPGTVSGRKGFSESVVTLSEQGLGIFATGACQETRKSFAWKGSLLLPKELVFSRVLLPLQIFTAETPAV